MIRGKQGLLGLALRAAAISGLALPALAPAPALAQFSDSYTFLKAVRDRDGAKATDALQKSGTVINTRDTNTGETALHIAAARRDLTWLGFLLGKGANANATDNKGNTSLILAAQLRWIEGARILVTVGAAVDKPNSSGETALIRAVQQRDVAMVQYLISAGANPDKRDTVAGMSAHDYAVRDGRTPGLVEALNVAKPAQPKSGAPVQGPRF